MKKREIHGMAGTPEYLAWRNAISRCNNPKDREYPHYGARGIRVCDRWRESFWAFYEDMGPKPGPEYSIERKNNDDGYHADNCRWATPKEQARNRRTSRFVEHNGDMKTIAQLAEEHDLAGYLVWQRIFVNGLSVDEALRPPKVLHEINGVKRTLSEWAEIYGIKYHTLAHRVGRFGMTIEEALAKPVRKMSGFRTQN